MSLTELLYDFCSSVMTHEPCLRWCLGRVIVSVCKTIASFQDMLLMDLYSGALCVDA